MPNNVDTRIVEMEFDNAQFERGAKQTLKTLDTLNKNLEFANASKSLETLQNGISNLNFDRLLASVQNAEASLTTIFGNIKRTLYETFAQDIVNTVQAGVQKVYNMTFGQIKSGGASRAMNLAKSKFKLEGLDIAWEKISDSIDQAVSGTAYGMDAAANVASQFAASGLKLGDTMTKALKAVSGVAAMTGSSFEDIGQIFNTVSGQGRLMADQLNQLSVRGINAAATLAKALHTTEANVREMTSKGQINFKTFYEAMYNAYAEHAFAANDTYEGALSNVKAALSRIGEIFYTPFYNAAIKPLNKLREIISNFVKALKNSEGKTKSFAQVVERLIDHLSGIVNILLNQLGKFMKKFNSSILPEVTKKLNKFTDRVKDLRVLLRGHFQGENWLEAIQSKKLKGSLKGITEAEIQAAKDIWMIGKYGNGQDRIDALEAAGLRAKVVQKFINDFIATGYDWEKVAKSTPKAMEQFNKAFTAMAKIFGSIQLVIKDVKEAFIILKRTVIDDIIPVAIQVFSNFADAIDRVFRHKAKKGFGFSRLATEVEKLSKTFADMFWNFDSGEPLFSFAIETLKTLFTIMNFGQRVLIRIIRFLATNISSVYWLADSLQSLAEIARDVIHDILVAFLEVFQLDGDTWFVDLTKGLALFLRKVSVWVRESGSVVRIFRVIFTAIKAVITILKALAAGFGRALNPFEEGADGTQKPIYSFLDALVLLIDKFIEFITESEIIERTMEGVGTAFKAFGDFIKGLTGNSVLQNILGFFDGLKKGISSGKLKKSFNDIIETVLQGIDKVWGAITGTNVGDGEDMGPLMTRFSDLKQGISEGDITAQTFGETLSKSISDAKKNVEGDMENIRLFFESLSETIRDTKRDVEEIAMYLGGGLATALVWVGKWVMTESDLKGLEETDNVLGKIWRWLENVAELEEQKGPKTLGVGNLIDKVTELYDGLKKLLPTIKSVAEITMIFNTGIGIKNFGKGILAFAKGITGIGSGFAALAKSVGKATKIWAKAQKTLANATFLTSFAALLLVVLAGITVLTSIIANSTDGGKSLYIALSIMVGVIAALVVVVGLMIHWLSKALKENDKFPDALGALAKLILFMSLSVLMLAGAFALMVAITSKYFGDKSHAPFFIALGLFVVVLAAIIGMIAYIMEKIRGYSFLKASNDTTVQILNGIAKLLTSFGASILILAIALGVISYIVNKYFDSSKSATEFQPFYLAIGLFVGLLAAMFGLVAIAANANAGKMSAVLGQMSSMFTALGVSMVLCAVALGLIAAVFKEHADDPETVGKAIGVLALFMVLAVTLVAIAAGIPKGAIRSFESMNKLFYGISIMMLSFSVAFGIMAEVLRRAKKNNVDMDVLMSAMGFLLGIVAIVALVGTIGGAKAGVGMIAVAGAILILSGAMIAFAKALSILADIDSDSLNKVLKAIGTNFGWMIGAGFGLVIFGAGSLVAALGIAALAGALFLMGIVLTPLMPILSAFMDMFQKSSDSVEESSDKLSGSLGTNLGAKIGEGLRDFVKSIKKYAPEIIKDVSDIMALVVEGFFAPLQGIGKGFIDVTVVSLGYINEHLDDILTPLGEIIDQINTWIKDYAPKIAETVALVLFYIFNGAFVVLAAYADILAENLYEAFASLLEAFGNQLTGEKNARVAAAIAKIVDGLLDLIKKTFKALSQTEMAEAGANLIEAMVEGIKAVPNKIKKALNEALGVEFFDVGEDLDMSMHAGEMGWRVENGDWIYDEELAAIQKEQEEAQKAIERAEGLKKDLAGGGGSSTTVNSIYDTKQMENSNKKAAELADEALGTVEDTKKELEKESKKADKTSTNLFGNLGLGEITDNLDMDSLKSKLSEIFNVKDMLPSSEDMTAGFSDMFGGMPDMNSIVADSGFDTSIDCAPVLNMDNAQVMQDGTLSDLSNFDTNEMFNVSGTTDISQSTASSVSAQLDDETSQLLKDTKKTLQELRDMMDNVTIVSNEAKLSTSLDVDGETLGTAVVPFVDAALSGSAGKAKNKVAQTYKKIKSR